jgi:hypothetical protein
MIETPVRVLWELKEVHFRPGGSRDDKWKTCRNHPDMLCGDGFW